MQVSRCYIPDDIRVNINHEYVQPLQTIDVRVCVFIQGAIKMHPTHAATSQK